VAYFPLADFAEGVLRPTDHRTRHGGTAWFEVVAGDRRAPRGAWQHVAPPERAAILAGEVAPAWRAMDAFSRRAPAAPPERRARRPHGGAVRRRGPAVRVAAERPLLP
jgi:hypothetical protein